MESATMVSESGRQKKSLRKRVGDLLRKFKELQGNPAYLARGIAIGVFVGFAPIMPLKSLSIVTSTVLLSGSTVAALLMCTLICNPLTYVPLYYIAWYVGDLLMPGRASWDVLHDTMLQMMESNLTGALSLAAQVGFDTAVVMMAGGCLVAAPLAFISYPIAHRFFSAVHEKRGGKEEVGEGS